MKISFIKSKCKMSTDELFFMISYVGYCIVSFYGNTMFMEHLPVSSFAFRVIRLLLVTCIFAKVVSSRKKYKKNQLISTVLTGIVVLAVTISSGYTTLIDIYVLCLCFFYVKQQLIIKVYYVVCGIFTIITVWASLVGIIQNLEYISSGHLRYSFGFIYPTDFAAHCLYLWLAYLGIKRNKFKVIDVVFSFAMGLFLYYFSYAKLDSILFIGSGILFYIFENHEQLFLNRIIKFVFTYAFIVLLILSITLAYCYKEGNLFWYSIDKLLTHRLSSGNHAIEDYGFTFFGQYIRQQGFGWQINGFDKDFGYFFIDSGYLQTLLCYGIIFMIIVSASAVTASKYYYKEKKWRLLLIVFVISISNFIDCRFLTISYSPYFFLYVYPFMTGILLNRRSFENIMNESKSYNVKNTPLRAEDKIYGA